jgi:hypothetical protein
VLDWSGRSLGTLAGIFVGTACQILYY